MPTAYREQYLLFIYSEYGATIASNAKLISHGLQMQRTPDPANKATTVYFDDDGLNVVLQRDERVAVRLVEGFYFQTRNEGFSDCHYAPCMPCLSRELPGHWGEACIEGFTLKGDRQQDPLSLSRFAPG